MPFRGRELKTFNASLGCYVGRFNAQIYKSMEGCQLLRKKCCSTYQSYIPIKV